MVSDVDEAALRNASTERRFEHGEVLHAEGEDVTGLTWIEYGAVAFGRYSEKGDFVTLAELGQGHHFGEYVILGDQPRRLAAVAIGATTVREVRTATLIRLTETHPTLLKSFLAIASQRLALMLEVYDDARRLTAPGRVAKFLLILQRHRAANAPLGCTQADLSKILGISKVTINRILKALEERGIVELGYGEMRIIDADGLQQFAASD